VLPALPQNANGKLDRAALPRPEFDDATAYEAPRGALERTLAALWAEVLKLPRVGRLDNFFSLGGHSLLAMQMLERLRRAGHPAAVRQLFQHPQLAAFARAIEGRSDEVRIPPNLIPLGCAEIQPEMLSLVELDDEQIARIVADVPGGAPNIQDIYPLAPLQEGILFHHRLDANADPYITPCLLSFDSRSRLEHFIDSVNAGIARHDILRTATLWEGIPEPVQVVARSARLEVEWLEPPITGIDPRVRLAAHAARHRIDVRRAPMLAAIAVQEGDRWLMQLLSHHLVLDHVTQQLLVEEVALIEQGRADALPAPVPFRDFVARARLGTSREAHEAFFRTMLGDVDEPTAPFGIVETQGDGVSISETVLPLELELGHRIRTQARAHGVGAAAVFHLAWAQVLARTSGRDDVVFGTVLFGRMQGGSSVDRAMGMFINTLPVRIDLREAAAAAGLARMQDALSELLRHEHASLALAQRCSGIQGSTPLFTALINYRYSEPDEGPLAWEGVEVEEGQERTNYPFTLSVDDLGESFGLVVQVAEPVGAERIGALMVRALHSLVESLEQRSDRRLAGQPLLAEDDLARLESWDTNAEQYADEQPVHRLIEAQVRRTPDAVALLFGDAQLSYAELNSRANRLAHRLIALGVRPEVRVGLALERSVEMVVALLAVLKAGGAYVPLDPEYPAERLSYMLEDSQVALLLTQSHLQGALDSNLPTLVLDRLSLEGGPSHDPSVALHGEHPVYVIYTSGSTGRPKGAVNRHRSLHNRLAWMQQAYDLSPTDTVLHKTPFGFDVSVWEFFWPLMFGARLAVAGPGEHREPARLVAQIRRHGVTTLHFVPSMLQAFLAHEGIEACSSLSRIVCSGEALPAAAQQQVFERLPQARLYNLYGPTEAAIDVTHWTCRDDGQSQVAIGRPIANTRAVVLDAQLHRVAQGVAGELYLGGIGLARGYLNRPGLTAERFVADPLGTAGERLYRTGDLVRWRADGQLEYLGRIDHQVKLRGLRIELGEIEAQLLAQPGIQHAVVVAREQRLVAYVASATEQFDDAGLKQALARQLPEYMVPALIVRLDGLPLNANGKVDRKALPQPQGIERAYEAPQGEVEEQLAAIWAEVLGIERVGRHDNFFEIGGHSLAVMEVAALVRQRLGMELALNLFFEAPTVFLLAQAVPQRVPRNEQLAAIDALLAELE
ncbi:amino acid adenylation domain-containing protein, partial [Roseateles sp. BYS180W]